jgi:hypothetical protein
VVGEQFLRLLVGYLLDAPEVGIAASFREPVDGLLDLLLAEFGLTGHVSVSRKG